MFAALFCLVGALPASAYTVSDGMMPSDLTVRLTLASQPIHNNFTRFVTFQNLAGETKSVAVSFTKSTYLEYEGKVTTSGLGVLQSLVDPGNRSYWDRMFFENHGGSTALDIALLEIEIEYALACCGHDKTPIIGTAVDQLLDSGSSSFSVSNATGRRQYIMDYFGWTMQDWTALPQALQYFFYDIGKSGSSDASDSLSSTNPKYASSTTTALCSETVSWYYHAYGVDIGVTDFRDITFHGTMHDAFLATDRLYCYRSSKGKWVRKDANYNWVKGDTYDPQPGDYFDRRDFDKTKAGDDGHAMMMIRWDASTGMADVIDGPWNVALRPVNVVNLESKGYDFCVGRIPFND